MVRVTGLILAGLIAASGISLAQQGNPVGSDPFPDSRARDIRLAVSILEDARRSTGSITDRSTRVSLLELVSIGFATAGSFDRAKNAMSASMRLIPHTERDNSLLWLWDFAGAYLLHKQTPRLESFSKSAVARRFRKKISEAITGMLSLVQPYKPPVIDSRDSVYKLPGLHDTLSLALKNYELGKQAESLEAVERAIALLPNQFGKGESIGAFEEIIKVLGYIRQTGKALELASRLPKSNGSEAWALQVAGSDLLELGRQGEAAIFYERAIDLTPQISRIDVQTAVLQNIEVRCRYLPEIRSVALRCSLLAVSIVDWTRKGEYYQMDIADLCYSLGANGREWTAVRVLEHLDQRPRAYGYAELAKGLASSGKTSQAAHYAHTARSLSKKNDSERKYGTLTRGVGWIAAKSGADLAPLRLGLESLSPSARAIHQCHMANGLLLRHGLRVRR